MKKVIITCALTGSVPSKEKFPALPITVDEIVNDAIAVYEAGAAVVHVHVRDRVTGKNSHDIEQFREIKRPWKPSAPISSSSSPPEDGMTPVRRTGTTPCVASRRWPAIVPGPAPSPQELM